MLRAQFYVSALPPAGPLKIQVREGYDETEMCRRIGEHSKRALARLDEARQRMLESTVAADASDPDDTSSRCVCLPLVGRATA